MRRIGPGRRARRSRAARRPVVASVEALARSPPRPRRLAAMSSGTTGLKYSSLATSAAAMKRCTPAARHGETISTLNQASSYPVADRRTLVQPHHVGQRRSGRAGRAARTRRSRSVGERVTVLVARRRQVGQIRSRGATSSASRERRCERHPGPPRRRIRDQPFAGHRRRAATGGRRRAGVPATGHVVVGVDLAVRVGDGRADLGAAVLEHEHVVDVVASAELVVRSAHRSITLRAPSTPSDEKRRVVVRRVEHDLAALAVHRRPSVGEPPHVVRLRCLEPADAERAARRRQVRARLAGADDVHDGAEHRIDADLGHPLSRSRMPVAASKRCTASTSGTRLISSPGRVELSPSVRATTGWSVDARRGAVQVATPIRAPRPGRPCRRAPPRRRRCASSRADADERPPARSAATSCSRVSGTDSEPARAMSPSTVADEQVHRRRADEAGDEHIDRSGEQLLGVVALLQQRRPEAPRHGRPSSSPRPDRG